MTSSETRATRSPSCRRLLLISALTILGVLGRLPIALAEPASSTETVASPYALSVPAPSLEGGTWVNVTRPITLPELHGRFVLLDFWTYCCINCMHVLPELKKLEVAYPDDLVIVGVHSAKFAGEHVTDNIREAVLRYEIEHPVINDADLTIWNRYGVHSWPTLVLIDPVGNVVWAAGGERSFEEVKVVIDRGLPYYKAKGLLKAAARPTLVGENPHLAASPLKFPGKILADSATGRLFVADSNHNRIVVSTLEGKLEDVVGSGDVGHADGSFEACSFNHPQGMALINNALYVADTENHLLRRLDLATKRVTTVAGTGEKGMAWPQATGERSPGPGDNKTEVSNKPSATSLSSPWAVCLHENDLYIAMAGMHQIWRMPIDGSSIAPYAGNGRENIADGPLLPTVPYDESFASFAQPSGLTSDGGQLFVADSEGSTVRAVPFDAKGTVKTLVGLTNTLFDFGDVDGSGRTVRLQHPLDVAWSDGKLYVGDTYNNKIKVIDPQQRSCRTFAGTGKVGKSDAERGLEATFNESGGISVANGRLYVADTNNHAIRVVDLASPNRVTSLTIEGLKAPEKK